MGWSKRRIYCQILSGLAGWHAALMFYTCLPIPTNWPLEFRRIARWVVGVGTVVGGLLAIADWTMSLFHLPTSVASILVVAFGIAVTGGLHLDGVMDVADGLAVPDTDRRLAVMSDSRMGAFGGMAAVVLILLKVLALAAVSQHRWFALIAVSMWGRWAQQWAIARYPYLKKEGKGAFHKAALPTQWHVMPSLLLIFSLTGLLSLSGFIPTEMAIRASIGGFVISLLTNTYFVRKLDGHTGDTYGAVVEWTEAFLLCSLSAAT
ncbi:MAG: adenosylcobinamide-GDP ribazoletransferase [Cyanobacteria bacterium J06650_10]